VPERTCIGCRTKRTAQELLRLACTPEGEVFVDRTGRAPGRGAHVCFDKGCLRQALKPVKLRNAFKRPVQAPSVEEVYDTVSALLYERLRACLSMAQKARAVVSGHAALRQALMHGTVVYLLMAKDLAAPRIAEYRCWCVQHRIPYAVLFSKEELGRSLGRPKRGAVGFTDLRFGDRFATTLALLQRLEGSLP